MNRRDKNACHPDFWMTIDQEAKPGHGEDSWCRRFSSEAGLLAVFDGCGGLGAQHHSTYGPGQLQSEAYANQTEAYMSSRLCAGAFYDAFDDVFPSRSDAPDQDFLDQVSAHCAQVLTAFKPSDGFVMRGAMVKSLPTTAAAALVLRDAQGYQICPIWAGDSRAYLLTSHGLAQLTSDDATVSDPMANLYDDGILRNVLTADKAPQLNHRRIGLRGPFLVFTATDGCFGYFSTPMEFEGAVLEALEGASCVQQWEDALRERIARVAGDDFTFVLAAYGYGSFPALKQRLLPRLEVLRQDYLSAVALLPTEDRASREALWAGYRDNYLRYMKDDT